MLVHCILINTVSLNLCELLPQTEIVFHSPDFKLGSVCLRDNNHQVNREPHRDSSLNQTGNQCY